MSELDDDGQIDQSVVTQTRFRIKLLVPPEKEKEQMLVMEGEVTQVCFGGKVPTYLKMMKCLNLILTNKCYIVEVKRG